MLIKQSNLDILVQLQANNNREWFADNKKQFVAEENHVKAFFKTVYNDLNAIDSIEKIKLYRIYRDVRFSKNKVPYKSNFSVGYSRTKPLLRGGYYLQIANNNTFIGGGFWEPNKSDLLRIRKELELDASELRELINEFDFIKMFESLKGEELKSAPRDFDKNHPNIDLIRKKQFLVIRNFTNEEVLSPNFKNEVVATFKAMRPFFNFMSDVLGTDLNGVSLY